MAVRLADYYIKWRQRVHLQFILAELVVGLATLTICYIMMSYLPLSSADVVLIGALVFMAIQIGSSPFIITFLTEPTKLITDAVTHVSKQANNVTPPNINEPRHVASGLKDVIQTIYELAIGSTHPLDVAAGNQKDLNKNNVFLQQLLAEMPCGVVALNKEAKVVFANKLAPVHISPNQEQELGLLFEQDNTLEAWLADCEKHKVRDTKTWTRVPSGLPDDKDSKIYDLVAYYQKDSSAADVILMAIDRTVVYAPMQEDMDFIALAAHELRGPITVIRGYLDVLATELNQNLLPEQKILFDRLSVSAIRLSTYINNILNVSRYDRRHLQLHLHEENLAQIFKLVIEDLGLSARTQNRILSVSIPSDLPAVAADRNSLTEVITNLTENAIKYSQEGGQVIVAANVKGNFVEVTIQDFGIGMPSAVVGNLFTKFYRSHKSRQTVSGTGLGLYICKAIVESHGGQIWARSTEGQGSTFGFTLPIYSTVADKLAASNNGNEEIIESSNGWIKNHSMYRG